MSTSKPSTHSPPRRKAVLFCIDCGHESAVDGDWVVRETHGRTVYECPGCGTTVTTRSGRKPAPC